MLKALSVIRTVFLVFVTGYTLRGMPWSAMLPNDAAQAYNVCRHSLDIVSRAAWLAIAWIAVETAVGWLIALRRGRKPATAPTPTPTAPGAPPT